MLSGTGSYFVHVERGGNTGFVMMTCKSDSPGRLFFTQLLCQRVARGNKYLEDFKSSLPGLRLQLGKGTEAVRSC